MHKKYLRLFVLALSITAVHGAADAQSPVQNPASQKSHLDWVKSYRTARQKGTASSRPVFLFVTSEECSYCKKMERESLKNQQIIRKLSTDFVPARLKLDPESQLARDLKVTMFPTTVIIAPDGKIVDYVRGYMSGDKLTACISKALKSEKLALSSNKKTR